MISGPAGSGKSALLSRILAQLASERHAPVATVEEPVQFGAAREGVVHMQRDVDRHCTSHAQGIESALAARAEVIAYSNLAAPARLSALATGTSKLCALLREQKLERIPSLYEGEPGMQSMDRSLLELATAGLLDGREAYRRASDKTLFSAWS